VRRHLVFQVRIVGDFERALAGSLGEVILGSYLQPPGDLPDEILFMRRARIATATLLQAMTRYASWTTSTRLRQAPTTC
jgi:hypothetical protein